MILLVIGPSGSGKSTIVDALRGEGLLRPHPTWTDRPRRSGEIDGVEHRFVSTARFDALDADGLFIGTTERFGHRYGITAWPKERVGLLTIVLRADLVDAFRAAAAPEEVIVHQIVASRTSTAERLLRRGQSGTELRARLEEHRAEVALGSTLADRTFVNDGDVHRTVAEVRRAVLADMPTGTAA